MLITKAARRYASAFLQIAREVDNLESILHDMELIGETIAGSGDLIPFLQSPVVKNSDKIAALEEIFGKHIQKLTGQFLELLTRKGRIQLLGQIVQAFVQRYNIEAGIIEIDVYAASELSDSQMETLHRALEKKTNKRVNMQVKLDESLRGGLAVRIDDTVIDGTVKHKLESLEERLLSRATD